MFKELRQAVLDEVKWSDWQLPSLISRLASSSDNGWMVAVESFG